MAITYVVKTGDNLTSIARKFNFKSWQELYNHPDNAEFRRKRPNPNIIFTGDELRIPGGSPDLIIPPPPKPTPPEPPKFIKRVSKKVVILPEIPAKMSGEKGEDYYYNMQFARLVYDPDRGVQDRASVNVDTRTRLTKIDFVRVQESSTLSTVTLDRYDFMFTYSMDVGDTVVILNDGKLKERVTLKVGKEIFEHPGHFALRPRRVGTSGWP